MLMELLLSRLFALQGERDLVRQLFSAEDFDEVFVSASLSEAEAAPKGLTKRQGRGASQLHWDRQYL